MTVTFGYTVYTASLSKKKLKALLHELKECADYDYFSCNNKRLFIDGSYDDQDGYREDHKDIEWTLDKYELLWTGKAEEQEELDHWDSYDR